METINDIVCEMRKDIPRVIDAKVILRNYADRIEAAHEFWSAVDKSRAAGEGYAAGKQAATCKDSLHVGNAAKMREALYAINSINTGGLKRLLWELVESDIFDGGIINKTISAVENARRALSAPATKEEAK